MSQTETRKGKMRLVPQKSGMSFEDHLKLIIKTYAPDYKYEEGFSPKQNFYEAFWEEDKFIMVKGHIFEIIEEKDITFDDIFEATRNPDGTIDYLVSYYNGGCSHAEAIGYALKNMEKK